MPNTFPRKFSSFRSNKSGVYAVSADNFNRWTDFNQILYCRFFLVRPVYL
jgi:hypothetical protein